MAPTTMRRSRRAFLRLGGFGLAAAGLAACAAPSPSAAPTSAPKAAAPAAKKPVDLRVGHLSRQLGNLVTLYPEVGPKHGVNFDVVLFQDGAALLQALSTGDVLLAGPTKVQLVQAMERGVDLVMIVGYAGGYATYIAGKGVNVKPGDWGSVKSVAAERKAKGESFKIGVPTASLQHIILLQQLQAAGIDAAKDVEILNVPFAEHANAVGAGQLDMAGALALFGAAALLQDKASLFKHATDTPLGHFEVGFVTTRKLIKERPADIQAIVNAHYEAMTNIANDPTHGLAREVAYTELPEAVVKKTYEFLTFDPRVDVGAIRATEATMRQLGLHKEDLSGKVPEYVDLSFLAKASGKSVEALSTW